MNQPDDDQLVEFLRRYRSEPPSASPDLEDRILSAIAPAPIPIRRRERTWFPAAIAATLVAGLLGYHLWSPTTPTSAELASLEGFMQGTWQDTVNESSDIDWTLITDSNTR